MINAVKIYGEEFRLSHLHDISIPDLHFLVGKAGKTLCLRASMNTEVESRKPTSTQNVGGCGASLGLPKPWAMSFTLHLVAVWTELTLCQGHPTQELDFYAFLLHLALPMHASGQ